MSKVNIVNVIKNQNKSSAWKKGLYTLPLIALLNLTNSSEAKIDYKDKFTTEITEVLEDFDIVANIEQRIGIKLPEGYTDKIREFMTNNKTLKKEIAAKFTEDFIIKEMKSDRGISKENQLLFIYCAIGYNYNQDFYTGDDGDNNRMSEFEKVMDIVVDCQTRYKNEFISYMQQISAEARQQSAEARQQSAEARQQSAEARQQSAEAIKNIKKQDSIRLKKSMIEFYDIYIRSPSKVKKEDIDFHKESTKTIIGDCKKYGIDYRAILLKEVGVKKKVEDMLKFYGVE